MDVPFLLSEAQMRRIEPYFPLSHGVPRVDDRRIVSAIIYVIKHGLMWRGSQRLRPAQNDLQPLHPLEPPGRVQPHLHRAGGQGWRARPDHDRCDPFEGASDGGQPLKRGALSRCIGRTKGGLNSKLHAVCDGLGRPIMMLLTEGQMSDHKGAFLMLSALPNAKELLADKGYDSDWFRAALTERGITPCIPPRKNRKVQYHYDKDLYRQRHKIENVFGRIKDWRRVATRYDRCAHTFMSAISIAATCCYWL